MPVGGDPDTEYSASVWVGIDGVAGVCAGGGLLQTGLDLNVKGSTVSYDGPFTVVLHVGHCSHSTYQPGTSGTLPPISTFPAQASHSMRETPSRSP
jgi:hypothetical protein